MDASPHALAAPLRPVLVELFTSEGCPSCPPADELLARLQGTTTPEGQQIIVLSEHVTYFDTPEWSDPFSKEIFSDRHSDYVDRFDLDDAYTPQVIVNGNHEMLGTDAAAIRQALQIEAYLPQPAGVSAGGELVHVVSMESWTSPAPLTKPGSKAAVQAQPQSFAILTVTLPQPLPTNVDVFAAVADDKDVVQVSHGLNVGRTITHVAVARSLARLPRPNAVGKTTLMVPLPVGDTSGQHLVLFVQSEAMGRVLSVVSLPVQGRFPQN